MPKTLHMKTMPRFWSFLAVITQVAGQQGSCDDGALLQLRNDSAATADVVDALQGALQGAKETCLAGGGDCLPHLFGYRSLVWPQVRALEGTWLMEQCAWMPPLDLDTHDDTWVTLPCSDGSQLEVFYRHIWKNAGWSIEANLQSVEGSISRHRVGSEEICRSFGEKPNHLYFTFGRDPISRFLAAYAELEFRFRNKTAGYEGIIDLLAPFPAGSVPRATAFFNEFLKNGINQDGHVKPQVEYLGFSQGCSVPIQFLGAVEQLQSDWARMFREAAASCQPVVGAFQTGLAMHANHPEDKARDKSAVEEVLDGDVEKIHQSVQQFRKEFFSLGAGAGEAAQRDMASMQEVLHTSEGGRHLRTEGALCWIYLPDFVVFGYDLPEQCQKDPALKELLEKTRGS